MMTRLRLKGLAFDTKDWRMISGYYFNHDFCDRISWLYAEHLRHVINGYKGTWLNLEV